MLCEEMETFKPILPNEFRKPVKSFEYLARNDRYTPFPHWFTVLRVYMTIPEIMASRKKEFFFRYFCTNILIF